ncbi:MAG: protein-glutamate O-methyltransferase CheR [Lachnospiraceae bacterium]|nr:protein-glutamate O-methyltransferase CheR [Lachnospiraceae bacterium]
MPIDLKDKRKTGGTITERKSIAERKNISDRAATTRDRINSLSKTPLATRNTAASNLAAVRSTANLGDYEYLKKQVLSITKVDLNAYKEAQMKRRIDQLITKKGLTDYPSYINLLKTDRDALEEFLNHFTINVSEFYRNPDQWEFMDKTVIPLLIRRFGKNLKIWSAACSTGDEPYSLVMALSKYIPINQVRIYATDIDKTILAKAKRGIYDEKSLAGVPKEFRDKYFRKLTGKDMDAIEMIGDSDPVATLKTAYAISDEIKSRVTFKQANLLEAKDYPKDYHMIVCRNVLIYFTEEAKDEVFRRFHDSLLHEGILFIGSTEQITGYQDMHYGRKNSFFYERLD